MLFQNKKIYFSRDLYFILEGFIINLLALAFSYFFLNLKIQIIIIFKLILIMFIINFSVMGFGLFIGSFALLTRSILFLVNTLYLILIAFSNANYQINLYSIFKIIFPLQNGIKAIQVLYYSGELNFKLLFLEILIGVLYSLIGYYLLSFLIKQSKIKDTFDLF